MITNNPMVNAAANMPYMAMAPMMGGVQYTQNQPIQLTTGLTKAEIEEMKKNGNGAFRLNITPEDMKRARCCHRDGNAGTLVSTNNPDKPLEVRCTLCGEVFQLLENVSPQTVTAHVSDTHDLLNTIKVMYVDLPPKLINEIFQIMPVMDKMGALFSIASDRFNAYCGNQNVYGTTANSYINGFNIYNSMMAGQPVAAPYNMGMMPQQPVYQQPYAQPGMFPQQPMQPMQQYAQPGTVPQMPYGQPMMNPMQQQMTAQAPGLMTNGFGVTEQPQQVATQQSAEGKPVVTKQLQA